MNGKRPWEAGNAALYALDVNGLGILWQTYCGNSAAAFAQFRQSEQRELFEDRYPINTLQFIALPASWNTRMLRQMGTLVYDSLQYGRGVDFTDFEDFIRKGIDPRGPDPDKENFTLYKIFVPYREATNVFRRLDLMGINGTRLFDNHEGGPSPT